MDILGELSDAFTLAARWVEATEGRVLLAKARAHGLGPRDVARDWDGLSRTGASICLSLGDVFLSAAGVDSRK